MAWRRFVATATKTENCNSASNVAPNGKRNGAAQFGKCAAARALGECSGAFCCRFLGAVFAGPIPQVPAACGVMPCDDVDQQMAHLADASELELEPTRLELALLLKRQADCEKHEKKERSGAKRAAKKAAQEVDGKDPPG